MRPGRLAFIGAAIGAAGAQALEAPFPRIGDDPYLDLIARHDPDLRAAIRAWYFARPAVAVVLARSLCLSVWRVWLQPLVRMGRRGRLPQWPAPAADDAPSLVVGELHQPRTASLVAGGRSWAARGQFPSANHYCQTALHELRHSTGHESRMKRETLIEGIKSGFGSPTKRGRNSGRRSAR